MVNYTTGTKRAVVLARRSIEKFDTASIEYQQSMCLKKAKELDYEVVEVIIEEKSAYNLSIENRASLQKILNMVIDNEVDAVICWQKSRLVRDLGDEAIILSIFEKSNCEVIFADPTEIALGKGGDNEDIQRLLTMIKTWTDQTEVSKLRSRVKQHLRERAANGRYVGGSFTGYQWNKHTKRMEQIPGEIDIVKDIYKMYLIDGLSTKQIAKALNDQGLKTKHGKSFYPYTVVGILQNKIYTGYYRWGFTTSKRRAAPVKSEGYEKKVDWIDPIIAVDDWNRVQQIMISRSGKKRGQKHNQIPKSSFLLSNKLFCGYCGGKMHGRNGSKSYKRKDGTNGLTEHLRYYCNSQKSHPIKKTVDSKLLDSLVLKQLAEEIQHLDKDVLFEKAKKELEIATNDLFEEKKGNEIAVDRLNSAIENLILNVEKTTDPELVRIYSDRIKSNKEEATKFKNNIREIEKKIKKVEISERDLNEFLDYFSTINEHQGFNQEKKRLYIENLVDKVVYKGDHIKVTLKWDIRDKSSFTDIAKVYKNFNFNMK